MSSVLTLAKAFFDGDVDVDAIPSTSAIRRILVATDKICDMMIIDELEDAEYVHILFDTSKKCGLSRAPVFVCFWSSKGNCPT